MRTTALTALFLALPTAAFAQSYQLNIQTGSLSSIAGTGTALNLSGDDSSASFVAPVGFQFFGTLVPASTSLYVTSNGLLTIGVADTEYSNTNIPTSGLPNHFLAPFWDDLNAVTSAEAYWALQGNEIVVEWNGIESLGASGESVTFQVRIDSVTGVVRYVYGARIGGQTWSGTVGLEDSSGAVGVQMSCGNVCTLDDVPNGTTLVFTPGVPTTPDLTFTTVGNSPGSVLTGETVAISFTLANSGMGSTNGSVQVGLFIGLSPTITEFDELIGSTTLGAIAGGSSGSGSVTGSIPSGISGTHYLGLIADPDNLIAEGNEGNNNGSVGAISVSMGGGDITITTTSLPPAQIGMPYDVQLTQVGASEPTWTIVSGALPTGLSLSTDGRITGTPAVAELASFTVSVSEPGLTPGSRGLTLEVTAGPTGLRLVSSTLPPATVGVPYSGMLEATGGAPPYAIQVIVGRPDWLLVDSMGAASGTPDAPGSHALTVSIFDSTGADATVMATLDVVAAGPLALSPSLPMGVNGRAYSARAITGGTPPYTVNVVNGAMPPGFAIDALGTIGGQATASGTFTFDVSVTDAATPPGQAGGTLTLTIGELTELVIATGEIAVTINTDTSEPVVVRGGVPPYTVGIVAGTLLPGLSFDPATSSIVGRADMVATTTVTFSAMDAEGMTATRDVVIRSNFFVTQSNSSRRDGCGCTATERSGSGWPLGLLLVVLFFRPVRTWCRREAWKACSRVGRRSSGRSDLRRPHRRS